MSRQWRLSRSSWTARSCKLLGWWTLQCSGRIATWRKCESSVVPIPSSMLVLYSSSIWLFLSCILYNKTVAINIAVFWGLWAILENFRNWAEEHVCGNPQICDWMGRNLVLWGHPRIAAGIWSGGSLVGLYPITSSEVEIARQSV